MRPEQTAWLEQACDEVNADLPPLKSFVLPGGTPGGRPAARLPHGLPARGAAHDRLRRRGQPRVRALPQPPLRPAVHPLARAPTRARSRCGSRAGTAERARPLPRRAPRAARAARDGAPARGHWARLGRPARRRARRAAARRRRARARAAAASWPSEPASTGCTASPPRRASARGSPALRNVAGDLLLERNQALRLAVLDVEHVTTLLPTSPRSPTAAATSRSPPCTAAGRRDLRAPATRVRDAASRSPSDPERRRPPRRALRARPRRPRRRQRARHARRGDRRLAARPRRAQAQRPLASARRGAAAGARPRAAAARPSAASRAARARRRPRARAARSAAARRPRRRAERRLAERPVAVAPREPPLARRTSAWRTPRSSSSRDDRRLGDVLDAVDVRLAVGLRRADVAPARPLADRVAGHAGELAGLAGEEVPVQSRSCSHRPEGMRSSGREPLASGRAPRFRPRRRAGPGHARRRSGGRPVRSGAAARRP